jgi:hypothetical protein
MLYPRVAHCCSLQPRAPWPSAPPRGPRAAYSRPCAERRARREAPHARWLHRRRPRASAACLRPSPDLSAATRGQCPDPPHDVSATARRESTEKLLTAADSNSTSASLRSAKTSTRRTGPCFSNASRTSSSIVETSRSVAGRSRARSERASVSAFRPIPLSGSFLADLTRVSASVTAMRRPLSSWLFAPRALTASASFSKSMKAKPLDSRF